MKKLILLLAFFTIGIHAQELPPVLEFDAPSYLAGNQNWMIGQNNQNFIFFANNEGLLEYNGATFTLYPSPNETIIRSVKVVGDRIYTGCYMEFGYWTRQSNGKLIYHSLSKHIKSKLHDDEQFWNILTFDNWVIFQSLNQLYLYDTQNNKFKIVSSKSGILKAFQTQHSIFYQAPTDGIYEIDNGRCQLIISAKLLGNKKVVNIFPHDNGLMLQTQHDGLFLFANDKLTAFSVSDDRLAGTTIYSSIALSNGGYALGSVSNGLFVISQTGQVQYHLTQNNGLSNNTVLSLSEDTDKNLWVGLDNGINCINLNSPIKSFTDNTGILGTVYTSLQFNNRLYVGTNQGLFCKKTDSKSGFEFVAGTKGQVWSLFSHQNTLFCGHDSGTYVIDGSTARNVFNESGTWKFEIHPTNPNRIVQGNYNGLTYLQKSAENWLPNKIQGFSYSTKYFEIANQNIYVSHEYKGVFKLKMNSDLTRVENFKTYQNPPKGKNAALEKFNGSILYANKNGIFKLDVQKDIFIRDSLLSLAIDNDEYTSGKMVTTSDKLWIFTKNRINYFSLAKMSSTLRLKSIPIKTTLTNSMSGYENISQIGANTYLVGTTDGYYSLIPNEISVTNHRVSITSALKNKFNQATTSVDITGEVDIPYRENNITITFAVPVYTKYIRPEYQFLLEGATDQWSDWSNRTMVNFKNLPYGSYTFKVRARTGELPSQNTAEFNFVILRPWYFSWLAIAFYTIVAICGGFFIHRAYKNYYQKQNAKILAENQRQLELRELETQRELMRIKNEQLQLDVDIKNRELAASTMNLIKKNELLALIKDDLKKTEDSSRNIKGVISTINKNISEEDTWDLFKEAFNNADKDFLKKIKVLHPALTPNDLRLCAYLRLNLSSKEIAPLLNISIRSVEIKRYRLRKKMELDHNQGLVEYILAI